MIRINSFIRNQSIKHRCSYGNPRNTPQLTAGVFIFGKFAFVRRDNLNPKKELAPPWTIGKSLHCGKLSIVSAVH